MKLVKKSVLVPLALGVGALAFASFGPQPGGSTGGAQAIVADDEPPPECPLCGGDPVLHARRLANLAVLRFEIAFARQMELR
jgi:hypothetical protein